MRKLVTDSGLVFARSLRAARRQAAVVFVAPTALATAIVLLFDALYGTIAEVDGVPRRVHRLGRPRRGDPLGVPRRRAHGGVADRRSAVRLSRSTAPAVDHACRDDRRTCRVRRACARSRPRPPRSPSPLLLGADHRGGLAGLLGLLALCCALAVAWNGIFYAAALLTLNPAVIQGLQPVTFMPAVMFSTFWVPAALMPAWYRWVSDHNPATPIIDSGRSIMLGATDWDRLATSALVLVCLTSVTYALAGTQLARLLRNR